MPSRFLKYEHVAVYALANLQVDHIRVVPQASQFNKPHASAFVSPQMEALATRGHDGLPAAVQWTKGNRLRRSSCLRVRSWRFQDKYLGIYKSIPRL
jgi:hypothetical protein